jgi:excisionase family DNA binding protein
LLVVTRGVLRNIPEHVACAVTQPRIAFGVTPDDRAADDASAVGAEHPAPTANSPFAVNLFRLEGAMKRSEQPESFQNQTDQQSVAPAPPPYRGLPNRLLTALEVAEFVGCHEETVRRAYLRGLLTSQRFGVRGRRFHPADVMDWIRRGAPTRVS